MTKKHDDFFILHGEDDEFDVTIMSVILGKIGYCGEYHQLATGSELLDWIDNCQECDLPNLIILDIGLPGINGKDLLGTLRTNDQTKLLPIIMMSNSCSKQDYEECILLGANAYIQKTPDIDNLLPILQNFVEGWVRLSAQPFF